MRGPTRCTASSSATRCSTRCRSSCCTSTAGNGFRAALPATARVLSRTRSPGPTAPATSDRLVPRDSRPARPPRCSARRAPSWPVWPTALQRGAAFFIDYGFPESEYYHPQRSGGTLMCHRAHRADADPLADVGEKDITSHLDFTAIALAGQDAGMDVIGYTSQARFLVNCGIGTLMEEASLRPARRRRQAGRRARDGRAVQGHRFQQGHRLSRRSGSLPVIAGSVCSAGGSVSVSGKLG